MNAAIDLRRLHHLALLAEELNFSRAAERAFLSPTAFSRSIQSLESDFGLRLFDRDTRSVQITYAGQQVLERSRELLTQAGNLAKEVSYLADADGGTLSFGASLFAIDTSLHGVLPRLKQGRPNLKINIEVSRWQTLLQHLDDERIEFFVAYPGNLESDPRYGVITLPTHGGSVYCRSGHPLLDDPNRQHVRHYPWAALQMDDVRSTQLRGLFGVPAEDDIPLALCCDNLFLLRETTLTSDTLLFTWSAWIQEDLKNGTLRDLGDCLYPPFPPQARQVKSAIVMLAGRTLSPAGRRLVELLAPGHGSATEGKQP